VSSTAIPLHAPPRSGEAAIDATIAAAQHGDDAAFASLYDAHAGRVFALCLRLSGDRTAAAELVQDVFVRLWERLSSYRGDSAFSTWLHRVALNTVLESGRKGNRRRLRVQIAADFANVDATFDGAVVEPDPHAAMDIEAAIATLPAGARAVFTLYDIEGYGHGEIAALLGIAEGTSKAHLFRARRLLRQRLAR
jgi:RNA polymerase sigma-70 factor (ECF subfamily)